MEKKESYIKITIESDNRKGAKAAFKISEMLDRLLYILDVNKTGCRCHYSDSVGECEIIITGDFSEE